MPHPPPTISARQFRDELQDLADRVALCGWPAFDADDQQSIKLRQPAELFVGFITLPLDRLLHTTHLTAREKITWLRRLACFIHEGAGVGCFWADLADRRAVSGMA